MTNSQNGFSVITANETVRWNLPVKSGSPKYFLLRPGYVGFILTHYGLYHHEMVQPLNTQEVWDDWSWSPLRPVRGTADTVSNHCSGTALDLNATLHPLGKEGTYSKLAETRIHKRLKWMQGSIRWGGDYHGRKDEMHFEINWLNEKELEKLARRLRRTPRGIRILRANKQNKIF